MTVENIGDEFLDLVTISPNLQIHQQSIGVAAQVNWIFYLSVDYLISYTNYSQLVSRASTVSLGNLRGIPSDIDVNFFSI